MFQSIRNGPAAACVAFAIAMAVSAWAEESHPVAAPTPTPDPYAQVRGMTISCPGNGLIWGTDTMVASMEELRDLGVNWIAIHPYAGISADGSVRIARRGQSMYDDPVWLRRPIREAKRLGLKILVKPHLAYWGSPFSWRGEITFQDEAQWTRFFETYEAWITMVAELCADADAFAVGTELGGTVHREAEWRRVIAAVRTKTTVPLTYAANWDRFDRVPFWDAIDVIGIQAYFPLVTHANLPEPRELEIAWTRQVDRLAAVARRYDKKILFAELGYNRSAAAARTPWDYQQGGDHAEETQIRCMRAALAALDQADHIVGAFLWKWIPGRGARDFRMQAPAMRAVIAERWQARRVTPRDATPGGS